MPSIAENIASIRSRMDDAARRAGRDPRSVQLCAATKMNDAEAVRLAIDGGVDCCGENRVQELLQKHPQGAYEGKPIHFIGHLQTNKVRQVVGLVHLIQSVDRPELLSCIEKEAAKKGLIQDILLEVNIGAEDSKSGFTTAQARKIAAEMAQLGSVRLRGLMAIPPISQNPGDNCGFFAEMRNLFVDISEKKYDNVTMDCLSMGMSDDFEDAIAEGSTMIRVGTAIFGARHYG